MIARKDQCCGNCDASLRANHTDIYCRLGPAIPVMVGVGAGILDKNPSPVFNYLRPLMHAKQGWCRQWNLKTEGEG